MECSNRDERNGPALVVSYALKLSCQTWFGSVGGAANANSSERDVAARKLVPCVATHWCASSYWSRLPLMLR